LHRRNRAGLKRIGVLALALVIALGSLGVAYSAWTDSVYVLGTVNTGTLCFSIQDNSWGEVAGTDCPDQNWTGWAYDGVTVSCPEGYHFTGIVNAPEDKCVATVIIDPVATDGNNIDKLIITINKGYPYLLMNISFSVYNCGTTPITVKVPVFDQDPSLLIEFDNSAGTQIEPGQSQQISFKVGVTQYVGHSVGGVWVVDDTNQPLTPEGESLRFTISLEGIQWNMYGVED
jgi:hypothetical protein